MTEEIGGVLRVPARMLERLQGRVNTNANIKEASET